jgi:hypothetical protein
MNIKQTKKYEMNMYSLSDITVNHNNNNNNKNNKRGGHLLRMNDTHIPIFMNEHTATYTKNVGSA